MERIGTKDKQKNEIRECKCAAADGLAERRSALLSSTNGLELNGLFDVSGLC